MPEPRFREGDRVLVGGRGFGRQATRATVAADWDGESLVMVVPEGRSKPVPRAASQLRHEKPEDAPSKPPLRTVRPSTTRATLRPVPRPRGPVRSPQYLAFVRRHPCGCCQRTKDVEAHHWAPTRGVGQKVSDYRTVALCEDCHRHYHDTGHLPGLDARTSRELFITRQAALLEEWILALRERAAGRSA